MQKLIAILAILTFSAPSFAQKDPVAEKYAATITKDDLYDYLSILASDALEGRETGKRGQKMAAAFISAHFEELGLIPPVSIGNTKSYLQPVPLYSSIPGETFVEVNGERKSNFKDVIYYGSKTTKGIVSTEVVFVGNGSEEEIAKVDIKDKAVLVFIDDFRDPKLAESIYQAGANIIFAVIDSTDESFENTASRFSRYLSNGRLSVNKPETDASANGGMFIVSPSLAGDMVKTSFKKLESIANGDSKKSITKVKTSRIKYQTQQKVTEVKSENVLGYLEGSDKKDELVVITAHYDHEGIKDGKVYNGADDDGSGTSAVMELAQAFVQAKKDGHGPRRSILFMTVTGEEKGLLGSAYYAEHPVFPLENTVVDLNIDMIGRIDPGHKDNPNYVYLVGSNRLSTELHEISENANKTYTNFDLDYTFNDENHPDRIYYRSDHWNFAKHNVPIIFYFNGTHEDYHQPTDTIDKITFDVYTKRAKLVFYTAWELANRDNKPAVDKK